MAGRITPFGKYFLLDRINVGGMAEVYKAKTVGVEGFEKIVAIKRILPSVAEDEEFIKMFVDEAKITSQLSHANLCQTFDLGKIDDTFYIAMEYVPGRDLRAVFERMNRRGERMPLMLAAYVMARVCDGLDYAHRKRDPSGRDLHIVHRDVSPQNIIVSYEGEVKLIDFGIAKAANKITKTQAGILKGKFGYMSPEQVRGLALDGRSDIFAAGVVLYELATSERLFTGASDFSVLEKVQQAKVPPPSQIEPAIPLRLERIILKALAREPEDRYQQAADFAHDLTRFLMEAQSRAVTREDVAAFMKGTFPEDREEISRPVRRPPPRISEPPEKKSSLPPTIPEEEPASPATGGARMRAALEALPLPPSRPPPPLPTSLTADLDERSPIPGERDPDRTQVSAAPEGPPAEARAEIIVKSKLPPMPDLGPLPMPRPDPEAGDMPTRPMSMDELAKAERDFIEREKRAREVEAAERPASAPPKLKKMGSGENTPTPEGPPSSEALAAAADKPAAEKKASRPPPPLPATLLEGVLAPAEARPVAEPPKSAPPPVPEAPPVSEPPRRRGLHGRNGSRSISKPRPRPPPPQIREENVPVAPPLPEEPASPATGGARMRGALAEEPASPATGGARMRGALAEEPASPAAAPAEPAVEVPLENQKTQVKKAPSSAPARPAVDPYQGRMQLNKPMLLADDAQHPGDVTSSNVTPRARWMRRAQYGIVLLALAIAAWALLSTPRPAGQPEPGAENIGALAVTVDPADAQLLLDGALVKDAHDAQWSAARLSAGSEHVLTARRDGYSPQSVPLTLKAGETKQVAIALQPSLGDIAVLSSPAGAQVYVDGVRRGTTPAWVPNVDSRADHAVTVEKKCYRTWQVALPARTGRRQVAATLQPAAGACPGHHLETSGMPAPEGLPDEAAQASMLGFLNLGSRPSAQVVIDGVDIGQTTPLLAWPLKSGSHQIRLLATGSAKELAVEIRTGETHSEIVDLAPAAKKRGRR